MRMESREGGSEGENKRRRKETVSKQPFLLQLYIMVNKAILFLLLFFLYIHVIIQHLCFP